MSTAPTSGPRWLLGFDASTPIPVVVLGTLGPEHAVLVGGDAIESRANQASTTLIPRVEALVRAAGIAMRDVSVVACGCGPGTFTGSRVAAAAAKGLALGLGVPVVPVSTLAALAAGVDGDGDVLALLDARRGEVYAGCYALTGSYVEPRGPESCAKLSQVVENLPASVGSRLRLVGPGVEAYADQIPTDLRARAASTAGLTPAGLWRAAVSAERAGAAVSPGALDVVYLRASYAEMGINTPKRPPKRSPWV